VSGDIQTGAVRVVIADDQALVRGSFACLIDTEPGFEVVGEAATGIEAIELAAAEKPDVVLMDVRMPGLNGIEAAREICRTADRDAVRVLMLTTFDLDEYVYAGLRAGASGFLLKDIPPADLLAAIRVVARGDALLDPGVTRRLIAEFAKQADSRGRQVPELTGLTAREHETLGLVARGLSNSEIAEYLHLSHATVKTYIGNLLSKLGARDRAQLVIIAYETGTVSAGRGSQ